MNELLPIIGRILIITIIIMIIPALLWTILSIGTRSVGQESILTSNKESGYR
jgi:hypothetical protein